MELISLPRLAIEAVEYEKALLQQQQEAIALGQGQSRFYALSVGELLALLDRIKEDYRLGKLDALSYDLMKGLLEERLVKLKRAQEG